MTNAQEDEKELEEVMTLIFITRIDTRFAGTILAGHTGQKFC